MQALCYFNSVRWVHDYQEACVDKLERFIRGNAFLKTTNYGNIVSNGTRSPNVMNILYSSQTSSRSRTDSGRSSPSRLTPLKINRQRNDSYDYQSINDYIYLYTQSLTQSYASLILCLQFILTATLLLCIYARMLTHISQLHNKWNTNHYNYKTLLL